jgi:hypothetical protein
MSKFGAKLHPSMEFNLNFLRDSDHGLFACQGSGALQNEGERFLVEKSLELPHFHCSVATTNKCVGSKTLF